MRTLAAIFVVGFLALAIYAVQPWRWLAPTPSQTPAARASGTNSGPAPLGQDSQPPSTEQASTAPTSSEGSTSETNAAADGTSSGQAAASPTEPAHVPNPTQPVAPGTPRLDTFDVIPSERTTGVDGNPVFDGEYPLKGQGTPESPYEVTWEYLTSIERTYDPSVGRRQVPDRITMLAGKMVRISGYIAFPIFDNRPNELLVMLNQWDGCCIGVPPTPYDAIEVRLATPVSGEARYATYGTITGKLGVEPYVVTSSNGKMSFLLGIYVLDGATMSGDEYGGMGGQGF